MASLVWSEPSVFPAWVRSFPPQTTWPPSPMLDEPPVFPTGQLFPTPKPRDPPRHLRWRHFRLPHDVTFGCLWLHFCKPRDPLRHSGDVTSGRHLGWRHFRLGHVTPLDQSEFPTHQNKARCAIWAPITTNVALSPYLHPQVRKSTFQTFLVGFSFQMLPAQQN